MLKDVGNLNEDLRRKRATAGRLGGLSTLAKYGARHFKKIGAKGAAVFWSRYKFAPVGTSDFAVVDRETGEVKSMLSGVPFRM